MEGGDFPSFNPSHPSPDLAFHTMVFAAPTAAQFAGQLPSNSATEAPPPVKKKRGRPRKYGPPSPRQTNASPSIVPIPRGPLGSPETTGALQRRKAMGTPGFGFTPHVLSVKTGEDVYDKVTSFMQTIRPFKSCILSASGTVDDVLFKLPNGSCMLQKGRFGIVTLSGLNLDMGDGGSERVKLMICVISDQIDVQIGGEIKGPLLAASDVQVAIGSFSTHKRQDRVTSPKGGDFHSNQVPPSAIDQGEGTSGHFVSLGSTDPTRTERDRDQLLASLAFGTQMVHPSSASLIQNQAGFSSWMQRSMVEDANPPDQGNVSPSLAQPQPSNIWRPTFTRFGGGYLRGDYHNSDLL